MAVGREPPFVHRRGVNQYIVFFTFGVYQYTPRNAVSLTGEIEMTDKYEYFKVKSSNGNQYLVEHYPEVQSRSGRHPVFGTTLQEYLPPRDVVKLEAVSGVGPEKGQSGLRVLRGVKENAVVGAVFHAATNEVIGMQFAKRNWPKDEKRKDEMYGAEVAYGSASHKGEKPVRPVPDDIKAALETARKAWRREI
jgi:hypothetical protein